MKKVKIGVATLLILLVAIGMTGCGTKKGSAKFKKGTPEAPGDVFELPKVSGDEKAEAIIAGVTRQAGPDDSITITGKGFSKSDLKAYIYAQNEKENGKAYEVTPTVVDDNQIVVTVKDDTPYGVYGVYVEAAGKTSDIWMVNNPKIWWIGFTEVTDGDVLSIYGENLTTNNEDTSYVYLIDEDRYFQAEVVFADAHKVSIQIPEGLEDGKRYGIMLHNGHGGETCFVTAEETIIYKSEKSTVHNGDTIDISEYGANPADDGADDSAAIQRAINAAQNGDTIYFPEGVYRCDNAIEVGKELQLKGAGTNKVKIAMGSNVQNAIFVVKTGPVEICQMSFYYVLESGELKVPFIDVEGDTVETDYYNFHLHDCHFEQSTSAASLSIIESVLIRSTYGILVENNTLAATRFIRLDNCKKVMIQKNTHYGTCYVGPYYSQDAFVVWDTDMMDASDNQIAAADTLSDDSGILEKGDFTQGRTFAIQEAASNLYISHNEFKGGGLPNDNAGEQIMLENIYNLYKGKVNGATANTITMPDSFVEHISKNSIFTIVSGTGVSQYRFVKAVKGKTITFSEDWDIIPDETSVVLVTNGFYNVAIHGNKISGYANYASDWGATCGVQVYGNIHNAYLTSNDLKSMCVGICLTSHYENTGDVSATNGVYWVIVDNNQISDVAEGVRFRLANVPVPYAKGEQMYTCMGVSVRRNAFSNIKEYSTGNCATLGGSGINYGRTAKEYLSWPDTTTWQGDWEWGSVIENNTFDNCENYNILLCKHQGKTVLRKNKVAAGDLYVLENSISGKPIVVD